MVEGPHPVGEEGLSPPPLYSRSSQNKMGRVGSLDLHSSNSERCAYVVRRLFSGTAEDKGLLLLALVKRPPSQDQKVP